MTKPVNLAALLGKPVPCPCNRGYMLKTDEDRERGCCVLCHMLSPEFKLIPGTPAKIWGNPQSRYPHEPNWGGDYGMPDNPFEADYD